MANKPIAVIIPEDKFRDEELFEPIEYWKANGIPYVIASSRKGEIVGDLGGRALATELIDRLHPDDYSSIVVIGGTGAVAHLWDSADLHERLRAFSSAGKLTASICAGSVALARSGLLNGRTATTYPVQMMTDALVAAGVSYRADGVIDHGDVITAAGPAEALDFAKAITTTLSAR